METKTIENIIMPRDDELLALIHSRLNYRFIPDNKEFPGTEITYDGFEMSGFGNDNVFTNLLLVCRFKDIINKFTNYRNKSFIIPWFWKGNCMLVDIGVSGEEERNKIIKEIGGKRTDEIMLMVLKYNLKNNPCTY